MTHAPATFGGPAPSGATDPLQSPNDISWRLSTATFDCLLTPQVWRQDNTGFSHQDPGYIDHLVYEKTAPGYPRLVQRFTSLRTNHANIHLRGYPEEGTTTPFDIGLLKDLDHFHLLIESPTDERVGACVRRLKRRMVDERRAAPGMTRRSSGLA